MNVYDYLMRESGFLYKDFLLGNAEQMSYPELMHESLKLARYLKTRHGEHNNILLVSPNSGFFLVAYLAIMKSGNVCVPLNPSIEPGNLAFIRKRCAAEIAFVAPRLNDERWKGMRVYSSLEQIPDTSYESPPTPDEAETFDEERLAEIIFTSGSTGEPKGVMISHGNIIANTDSIIRYLQLTGDDTMLVVLPFYYCYGLSLLHTHLKVGGSIVFNNSFMFLGTVIKDLKNYHCTGFAGVPSHFQVLLRKSRSFRDEDFPALRYVTQAGGKLHKAFISEFMESQPGILFYVMYGQTEATARLSYLPPAMLPEKLGSLGKAIPGVDLRLVAEDGSMIQEANKPGELIARGGNIMKGYLGDEEETAATIRDGWLHTGDIAYMDEDGYFYHQARIKEIIKVGGRRISPKEIEEVIVSIPGVVDCSISAVSDDVLGEALKADIVVSDMNSEIVNESLFKKLCGEKLAREKIPQFIQFSNRLEVAPTGKKLKKGS
ncbi:MAG: AMP-dependent synthetase [Bacteroidetes bacterium]|nr:MAG: AMP-dependent synthetase [Bacteroidota bacterium]